MTDNVKALHVELIMEGGWIIEDKSGFDPSLHNRAMQDISERFMRTGIVFSSTDLENLATKSVLIDGEANEHFKPFYDVIDSEILSISKDGNIQIDLTFTTTQEAAYNAISDTVTISEVMGAVEKARELGLSGHMFQAYFTSDPSEVIELLEGLAEEPELSVDGDYETGFICEGNVLKSGGTAHKYAVASGGTFYKLRGDKAFIVESNKDYNSDEDCDL